MGGEGVVFNLNVPELLCLPSDPQEMGIETFLQDFSKEKKKKNFRD